MHRLRWALFALLAPAAASATTMRTASLDELTGLSALVVVATPIASEAGWEGHRITTRHQLRLDDVIAGPARAGDTIEVVTLGGIVGGIGQQVPGSARLQKGRAAVLFLAPEPDRRGYYCVGMSQGVLYLDSPSSNAVLVRPTAPIRAMGPAATIPNRLHELKRAVRELYRAR